MNSVYTKCKAHRIRWCHKWLVGVGGQRGRGRPPHGPLTARINPPASRGVDRYLVPYTPLRVPYDAAAGALGAETTWHHQNSSL